MRPTRRELAFLSLYLIILLLHAAAGFTGLVPIMQSTKILLMPVIIVFLLNSTGFEGKRYLYFALLFSWAGDVFLLGKGQIAFLSGLVCFLLAHCSYILIFNRMTPMRNLGFRKFMYAILPPGTIALLVLLKTWNNLHDLKYPVLIYISVITMMYVAAANVYTTVGKKGLLLVGGATLFLASDAMLAISLFQTKNAQLDVGVMLTYGMAQILLATGIRSASFTSNNKTTGYIAGKF